MRNEPKVFESHSQDARYREMGEVAPTINSQAGTGGNNLPLVQVPPEDIVLDMMGGKAGCHIETKVVAPTIATTHGDSHAVMCDKAYCIQENIIGRKPENGGNGRGFSEEISGTLEAMSPHGVATKATVRRLLPIECERLMGFPDNWTRIPWRGKPAEKCPDAPRYKACGNSFCVNCVEWIGERIEKVERALQEERR